MSMTPNEMIAVILAHRDGVAVQWKFHTPVLGVGADWTDLGCSEHPFNFSITDYRIKPEPPKPREWWINPVDGNLSVSISNQPEAGFTHVREVLS